MRKKVRVICRSDDYKAHVIFNNNFPNAQWFRIPKGDNIRIFASKVYFDSVPERIKEIQTGKTIVIGYTPEITIMGLIPDADFELLKEKLSEALKEFVTITEMELKA